MRRVGLFSLAVIALFFAASANALVPQEHGRLGQTVIQKTRLESLQLQNGNRVDAKQLDALLKSLDEACRAARPEGKVSRAAKADLELRRFTVLYREILPEMPDNTLIPITDTLLNSAPNATFAGLGVYSKTGKFRSKVDAKYKVWDFGEIIDGSFTRVEKVTFVNAFKMSRPSREALRPAGYLKWGEIKDRVAFEKSDRKSEEDRRLESEALTRLY